MCWWYFFKENSPEPALEEIVFNPDIELEGTVFLEEKVGGNLKKRLLVYDEVAKCLKYYTPQKAPKGTINLQDIRDIYLFAHSDLRVTSTMLVLQSCTDYPLIAKSDSPLSSMVKLTIKRYPIHYPRKKHWERYQQ